MNETSELTEFERKKLKKAIHERRCDIRSQLRGLKYIPHYTHKEEEELVKEQNALKSAKRKMILNE